MEVDCPDCTKETKFFEWLEKPICGKCKGTLKIKVYTQTELDEAIKEEQDGCLEELECFMEHDICLFRSIEIAIRARGENV